MPTVLCPWIYRYICFLCIYIRRDQSAQAVALNSIVNKERKEGRKGENNSIQKYKTLDVL